jgi:subtilisin family serine protease
MEQKRLIFNGPSHSAAEGDMRAFLARGNEMVVRGDLAIAYVHPDRTCSIARTLPDGPDFGQLWRIGNQAQGQVDADINALEAWDLETGSNVTIGVIDAGIGYAHPDLANKASSAGIPISPTISGPILGRWPATVSASVTGMSTTSSMARTPPARSRPRATMGPA